MRTVNQDDFLVIPFNRDLDTYELDTVYGRLTFFMHYDYKHRLHLWSEGWWQFKGVLNPGYEVSMVRHTWWKAIYQNELTDTQIYDAGIYRFIDWLEGYVKEHQL